MNLLPPFSITKWIDENRHLLKPPVGNKQIYIDNQDFIVMVVGGPNSRKDFHYNEGEELFYQVEGDIELKIMLDGNVQIIPIKQGEMFLLPPRVPHCPVRPANTIGIVIEKHRNAGEKDGFFWYCENCGEPLHQDYINLKDIVSELPKVMNHFYESVEKRTCRKCASIMLPPKK